MFLFPMVMPEMLKDLGLDYTDAGLITGLGQVSPLFSIPLTAYLVQKIGGLRLIVYIQLLGAALLMILSLVENLGSLLLVIFLLRSWSVMVWIPLVAVAAEFVDDKYRATMLTVASGGACFFVLIDGNLSAYFLANHDWRVMWRATALICIINTAFCWFGLRWIDCWTRRNTSQKTTNSSLSALSLLVKSRNGITILLIFAAIGVSFVPFQMYLAPYLREDLGVGLKMTSLTWSAMGISGIIGGIGMGLFTDRFGVKPAFVITFFIAALSSILICIKISPSNLIGMAVLFGVAQAVIFGLGPAYISKTMMVETAAVVNSGATMFLVFISIGANFLAGWSHGFFGSFKYLFIVLCLFFLIGIFLTFFLKSERESKAKI